MVIDNQKWRMATCQHGHTLSYWACLPRKRRNAMQLLIKLRNEWDPPMKHEEGLSRVDH